MRYLDIIEARKPLTPTDTNTPEFKAWFGNSKVVDENGNPLIMYHGTGAKFSSFSKKKVIGSQFWFTANKSEIESGDVGASGSGFILAVYLSIQNPVGWKEYENLMLGQIRARGHDGIILTESHNGSTCIVFEPTQIKSIYNNGMWDGSNKNINR
jgi:ADP-Ribosyltransferase in polyvalent proteins